MVEELIGTRSEPTTIILLNECRIKLPSKFLFLPIVQCGCQNSIEKVGQWLVVNVEIQNWPGSENMCQWNTQPMRHLYDYLPRHRYYYRRGNRKTVRARGWGRPEGNSVFQIRQVCCSHELIAPLVACTRSGWSTFHYRGRRFHEFQILTIDI